MGDHETFHFGPSHRIGQQLSRSRRSERQGVTEIKISIPCTRYHFGGILFSERRPMAELVSTDEIILKDAGGTRRVVVTGDKVALSPSLKPKEKEFLTRFLEGPGPYTLSWVGRWPCGGVNLYFKMSHGREPGAKARDFVAIDQ